MNQTIFFVTRPPSLWKLYDRPRNSKHWSKSDLYRTWLNANGWQLNRIQPVDGPAKIDIAAGRTITQKGKWSRKDGDIDNLAKPVLDLLVKHGILKDDNAEYVHNVNIYWDGIGTIEQGKCRVVITPIGEAA